MNKKFPWKPVLIVGAVFAALGTAAVITFVEIKKSIKELGDILNCEEVFDELEE